MCGCEAGTSGWWRLCDWMGCRASCVIVGCRGLGDSDPSVTAESSASRREMAPSQITESQRKDSQQKDSDPSWDKNARTERAPQAGSWEYSQRTTSSGGRARTHTRGCSHSSALSTCRFRSHGIPSLKSNSSPAQPWPWLFSNTGKSQYSSSSLLWACVGGGWWGQMWSWRVLI